MIRAITSLLGVGLIPRAPGTWGSLVALPVGFILALLGPFVLLTATGIAFGIGWWATDRLTDGMDDHDPSEVVVDELVGQWITLVPLSMGIGIGIGDPTYDIPLNLLMAFCLFRLFDITKPFPVSYFDRIATPLGVMLDDVAAGIMAGCAVWIIAMLAA